MKGMHLSQRDYRVGQRVVAARDRRTDLTGTAEYGAMRVETVESIDEDARRMGYNARMELRHADEVRTVLLCGTSIHDDAIERTPWRTIWSEPLPDRDEAATAFAGAVTGTDGYRDVALAWVGCVTADGIAYVHLLTDDRRRDVEVGDVVETPGALSYGARAIAMRFPSEPKARSVVAARLHQAVYEHGLFVHHAASVTEILHDIALDAAAGAFPVLDRRPGTMGTSNLVGWHRIDEDEERAHAMTEPSEALTLCWNDGADDQVKCLAKTGIDFWRNDDPEAYARDAVPGPGLWMWRNVRYRGYRDHEGGYDADMDGDWQPATEDDVVAMVGTLSAAESDILHYVDEPVEDPVGNYIRMARALHVGDDALAA
jgi:hypothetical protein